MNVLSLFDGMGCGRIVLEKVGIKVDAYFASEIDKYAMQVSSHRYPDTIYVGSVIDLKGEDLPKIDLLIGGSPCQGFSFAGKQLNFDDPRSALFFEYVRLLEECKPKYFLLENVKMKKEYQDVISKYLGVEPIQINSSLLSAQNRVRLYWTNIPGVTQPEDLGIVLEDIIEDGVVDRDKSYCIDANYAKGGNPKQYFDKSRRQLVFPERPCELIDKEDSSSQCHQVAIASDNNVVQGAMWRKLTVLECERLQTVPDNYTLIIDATGKQLVSNSQRYKMLGNGWTVDVIAHILKGLL